ncbi:MAG: phosphatidylinositol-specific phospholipase C domain-containing protein [Bacteroidales bacterium]|nr:phosphatidylinositol-specific phospholipase C domain-containing protein [Bacteroidales bacterium]
MKSNPLMKFLGLILLTLLIIVSSCKKDDPVEEIEIESINPNGQDLPYQYMSWMSQIDDTVPLNRITIPGTHDSGADLHTSQVHAEKENVITQDFRISNQLKLGVRWFDIRLGYIEKDHLEFYHGDGTFHYDLHKTFAEALTWFIDFLEKDTTETVILMIKQEHTNVSDEHFAEAVYQHLHDKGLDNFYRESGRIPTLGDVRGKICIVRRFHNNTGHGLGIYTTWPEKTDGSLNSYNGVSFYVQDHYYLGDISDYEKLKLVTQTITHAHHETDTSTFVLNFVSGEYVPWHTLWHSAEKINHRVEGHLRDLGHDYHNCGIIMINFAGGGDVDEGTRNCAQNLVKQIIAHNPGVEF